MVRTKSSTLYVIVKIMFKLEPQSQSPPSKGRAPAQSEKIYVSKTPEVFETEGVIDIEKNFPKNYSEIKDKVASGNYFLEVATATEEMAKKYWNAHLSHCVKINYAKYALYATFKMQSKTWAYDVVQDALASVAGLDPTTYLAIRNVDGYIFRAINNAMKRYHNTRHVSIDDIKFNNDSVWVNPPDSFYQNYINKMVQSIGAQHAQVIKYLMAGYKPRGIAAKLGIEGQTARNMVCKARARFLEALMRIENSIGDGSPSPLEAQFKAPPPLREICFDELFEVDNGIVQEPYLSKVKRYLDGHMDPAEQQKFERQAAQDEFEFGAFAGLQMALEEKGSFAELFYELESKKEGAQAAIFGLAEVSDLS